MTNAYWPNPKALVIGTLYLLIAYSAETVFGEVTNSTVTTSSSSLVVNVQNKTYGAKGDGFADDTAAIQKAVNAVAGTGGTLLIPEGIYMVNTTDVSSKYGIKLGNNMTMRFSPNAILKAIPNASKYYAILVADNVNDIKIIGGVLEGERNVHTDNGGEWGFGLEIISAQNILIEGVTSRECWGDGFYITGTSENVCLLNVTADHNRRQGLSVISVNGLVVKNSTFKNTTGTLPEDGIDIEPDQKDTIKNILISNCTLKNNSGNGIDCSIPVVLTGKSFVTNIVIDSNVIAGNGANPINHHLHGGIHITNCDGTTITNNTITNNTGRGIFTECKTKNTIIKSNIITGTTFLIPSGINSGPKKLDGCGIWLSNQAKDTSDCLGTICTANSVTNNAGHNIYQDANCGAIVENNTVTGN